jgi:hypothetical protein
MIWTIMAHSHAKPKRNLEGVHQMYFELDEVGFFALSSNLKTQSASSDLCNPELWFVIALSLPYYWTVRNHM